MGRLSSKVSRCVSLTQTGGSSIRDRKEVYLVERTNPHELVSGIIELKKKPTLRKEIAEAGFARSRQNTPDALGRIFRQVIESIIS